MGFAVIHDAEKGIAALIDPDAGVALGPILQTDGDLATGGTVRPGERAAELLDIFASGLAAATGEDPAAIHSLSLARHFDEFVRTIADDEEPETAAANTQAAVEAERRGEPAQRGETGGLAGPSSSGESVRVAGEPAGENLDGALVADALGDSGKEQAREAADPTASAETKSADEERHDEQDAVPQEGRGVPKL
jgi:hypothetical protein